MSDQRYPNPPRTYASRLDPELLRDVLALLLMLAGTIGIVAVGFLASPLVGWALIFAAITAAGAFLGLRR